MSPKRRSRNEIQTRAEETDQGEHEARQEERDAPMGAEDRLRAREQSGREGPGLARKFDAEKQPGGPDETEAHQQNRPVPKRLPGQVGGPEAAQVKDRRAKKDRRG